MQIYARILNSKISSDMNVLAEKLKDAETKFFGKFGKGLRTSCLIQAIM
jgi:hypothetical protein